MAKDWYLTVINLKYINIQIKKEKDVCLEYDDYSEFIQNCVDIDFKNHITSDFFFLFNNDEYFGITQF